MIAPVSRSRWKHQSRALYRLYFLPTNPLRKLMERESSSADSHFDVSIGIEQSYDLSPTLAKAFT